MTITKKQNGTNLEIALEGRLDNITVLELETELKRSLEGAESLTMDFAGLTYISSAGLRLLLSAWKRMSRLGGIKITNANESIRELLSVTGYSDILTVE